MSVAMDMVQYIEDNIESIILDSFFPANPAAGTTREANILDTIVRGRIRRDLSRQEIGGRRVISLLLEWRLPIAPEDNAHLLNGDTADLYKIPPFARDYRDIVSVIPTAAYYTGMPRSGLVLPGLTNGMATIPGMIDKTLASYANDSAPAIRATLTATGSNILRVAPAFTGVPEGISVEVLLAYDDDFSQVSTETAEVLRRLAVLSVKQYIYLRRHELGTLALQFGGEIAGLTETIEQYRDAADAYKETLKDLRGASVMSPDRRKRIISYMC